MLSFSGHICTLLTAARMPKFYAAWTEKLEIFELSTLIFGSFFQKPVRKIKEKVVYQKKKKEMGSPTISESKLQAKLTLRLLALYVLTIESVVSTGTQCMTWCDIAL